ncbi:hypothetical protein [Magnetospirillum sp. SS-4]|uniref:hypothetical protein n=1 Tax=Magnetospirillum sp. SS-4 TaxID=2681465 RepID=UPI0013857134|nr:hypothetical protein [Magnetospirillum sp. SS-4]CAA7626231.1 hypothetical protein MTBSS4_60110 [Magnetospirillum sp. SS-4]
MTDKMDDCLDKRLTDIQAMIGCQALFQASIAIKGGRHCSAMHSCEQWHDCAWAHGALWGRVTDLLSRPR